MLALAILLFFVLPFVEESLYLYDTEDSLSVEFYDCIIDTHLPYCRRSAEPVPLQRDQSPIWQCHHNGTAHSFPSLMRENISVSTVLHQWNSGVEKAEEYSLYKKQRQSTERRSNDQEYLCECQHPQSFGKHCEYLLPRGSTFDETIMWQVEMRTTHPWEMQMYSDIVCYTTLKCNSGLLCLDWRDICDGVQHCLFGHDEENCDKLEFNECEDEEYRCANGMCILEEYFLDGEYDCSDFTDEKQPFNDRRCTYEEASSECDDRTCLRFHWSCGDGQCLDNRLGFQGDSFSTECNSLREQYFMCELHSRSSRWTLPNGKCYESSDYEEILVRNRTENEECIYFMKCVLSQGAEKNCPCGNDPYCVYDLENPCSSWYISYPAGALIAPYAISYYETSQYGFPKLPDGIKVNGTLKCRGYMQHVNQRQRYPSSTELRHLDAFLCTSTPTPPALANIGFGEFCYNDSRTFTNRSYNFVDICEQSRECISAYRIRDGLVDCGDQEDEPFDSRFANACSNIQRHRFRCSQSESTCLTVNLLGDRSPDCWNNRDERWMGRNPRLSELLCNTESKSDCAFLRDYVEISARNNTAVRLLPASKISFRAFCDTFWNLLSRKDEDTEMCRKWWKCPEDQWQCRSGQCIEKEWVLDGEWDCADASDEEGFVLLSNHSLEQKWFEKFDSLYGQQPFGKICNLSAEYPCFRANVSDPLDITLHRPCIRLQQIGDGQVDCVGGVDERNTLTHCAFTAMLGYHFQCSSTPSCTPYSFRCPIVCEENLVQCYGLSQRADCSAENDFLCLDGQCAKGAWCDRHLDCSHGEDELFCPKSRLSPKTFTEPLYREEKEVIWRAKKVQLQLSSLAKNLTRSKRHSDESNSTMPYSCNRGIGVHSGNDSIVCFCPPQYHGEKCQFHSDRLLFLFHLNLSQSIYVQSSQLHVVLRVLILFLRDDQPLMVESVQTRVADELALPRKRLLHFFYSRANASLDDKRARYFNRSDIIDHHPYSIRVEIYELNLLEQVHLVGVWSYPISFDFLPSFRLSKVLRLTAVESRTNPCESNPCAPTQQCQQIRNQNSAHVCLCAPDFKGHNCSTVDEMCKEEFCAPNALCKPNYRGLLIGNKRPYCLCPLNKIGPRCHLTHDACHPNPCENDGTCLSTSRPDQFLCLCDQFHHGDTCQLKKQSARVQIGTSPAHQVAVVQYFDLNFFSLDLLLLDQRLYGNLPGLLHYAYDQSSAPRMIVVKLYSKTEKAIYLLAIELEGESIRRTTELTGENRCLEVERLFEPHFEISPFQYHHLCIENHRLLCFVDQSYLCICESNHSRAECFGYDQNLDRCSFCLNGGQCVRENQLMPSFLCVCPRCYYGSLCQFTIEGVGFTLDSLLVQISRMGRVIYLVFSLGIFFIGGLTNYASLVTFKRPKLRKSSTGIYMLSLSVIGQQSLFVLNLKLVQILFDSLMHHVSCKIISYLLSVSVRCSFWLMSLIAIERACCVLFPFDTTLKKPRVALICTSITLLLVAGMHAHELIYYDKISDPNHQSACVVSFPPGLRTYDRTSVLVHYLIPFCIQIASITTLIILAARSRSRATINRDTFRKCLKQQLRTQKELYIAPSVIILSGLPQTILSFSFACIELVPWQQHVLLIAYFLSFAPQLLGFILFVLPSTNYTKEFQATDLSKTFLFRWIGAKKTNGAKK